MPKEQKTNKKKELLRKTNERASAIKKLNEQPKLWLG